MEIEPRDDLLGEEIEVEQLNVSARARAPFPRVERASPPPVRKARLALRRPRTVIAIWLVLALILGVIGLFAKQVLHPEDLVIHGTPSAKTLAQDQKAFGVSTPLAVMLSGPARALDSAGPQLVDRLNKIPGVSAASPWSAGAPEMLREAPGRALVVLTSNKDVIGTGRKTVPKVNAALASLPPTIHHRVAGEPRFSTELVDLVFAGALKAEILAFPFLLLILLLIFRAPIAAAIPLVQGLAVIGVTTGLVTLIGLITPINILAHASGSIIGLALGVDYSLLFVQRFREELALGKTTDDAVGSSMLTAGRTVTYAGGILVLAALMVIGVSLGWASMTTGSIGVLIAALVSIGAALTLLPACLKLVGPNIDRWPIGNPGGPSRLAPIVNSVTRRPVAATAITLIPLLLLCGYALSLRTGGPDLKMFAADNSMRVDTEAVARQYGGGIMAPYEVVATSDKLPLTSPSDIRALNNFQQTVAIDPATKYVIGLGNNGAQKNSAQENTTQKNSNSTENAQTLNVGLGAASLNSNKISRGLKTASRGARKLAAANAAALAGAQALANGLAAAESGSSQLESGLGKATGGAQQLHSVLGRLKAGTHDLSLGTNDARRSAQGFVNGVKLINNFVSATSNSIAGISGSAGQAKSAVDQAIAAIDSLPAATLAEPSVQSARNQLTSARNATDSTAGSVSDAKTKNDRVLAALSLATRWAGDARRGANELDSGAEKINAGVGQIQSSTGRLTDGLRQLAGGSAQLRNGLSPLAGGGRRLAGGLGTMEGGSKKLAGGLAGGNRQVARLKKQTDAAGAVDMKKVGKSPYLTMALLSAAPEDQKRNIGLVLNEPNGGTSTRTFVITHAYPTDKSLAAFNTRLQKDAAPLERKLGATVSVGGPGRTFLDYDNFTRHRIPILLAALGLASFLFLLLVFRSVLLAAKAVVLNLITVGAAMGLIALLYQGDKPLFGGPGWMEATSFFVVYSVTFALSMDYEIFMINRMRESYLRHGSNDCAISDGVTRTASIVTGSALVMVVLFTAMAYASELVSSAQLGLGLAFAIAIDATIVRLVLLPATMRLFGSANWWLPGWLDRRLPNFALH